MRCARVHLRAHTPVVAFLQVRATECAGSCACVRCVQPRGEGSSYRKENIQESFMPAEEIVENILWHGCKPTALSSSSKKCASCESATFSQCE
jgi:hypothetical protein